MSLDGYVSDKEGGSNFFIGYIRESYTSEDRMKFLDTIDTIVFGRNTYEQFARSWPDRPVETEALAAKMEYR